MISRTMKRPRPTLRGPLRAVAAGHRLEQPIEQRRSDRFAVVVHSDRQRALQDRRGHAHRTLWRTVSNGVGDEVADHLHEAIAVGDARPLARSLVDDGAACERETQVLQRLVHDPVQIDRPRPDAQTAADTGLAEVEQIGDQPVRAADGVADPLQRARLGQQRRRVVPDPAAEGAVGTDVARRRTHHDVRGEAAGRGEIRAGRSWRSRSGRR
jgi:hypothetical protein